MSDRDSDPAPFVRNSYIPETQQYLNYYGSQCYYEEPQALPQYYYFPQSQPQGPQVEGAGASMRNINSRNEVPVASESTAQSNEGAKTSGKRKSTKYETFPHAEERYLVNLWKENHDQLESKNACKVWNKIRACSHYAKFCLFCKKICQRETIFSANDFFRPRKFCQASPNFKETVE